MTVEREALQRTDAPVADAAADRRGIASVTWFVAVCLALATLAFLPAMPPALSPFMLALGPLLVAVVLAWREGNGAVRRLLAMLTKRPRDPRWYLVLLLPIAWALAVVLAAVLLGEPVEGVFDGVDASILIVVLVVLIPALAEELAWRGFAVPRLLPLLSPLAAALVLAVPWSILHLPLVLVPDSINEGLAVFPMVLALVGYSVILTWIVVGTGGSVLLTGLVHAGLNGVVPLFRGLDTDQAWLLRGIVAAGIAVLVILAAGMWRRQQLS
jgi:membrane protease YdiL (CAAX protease family)